MSERRKFSRRGFEYPVNISTNTRKDRAGMARDLSATGILFHSRSQFAIGERVVLMFHTSRKLTSTIGHVVRSVPVDNPDSMFRHATAVEFDVANLDLVA